MIMLNELDFFMTCLLNPEFQGKTLKELPFIKESLKELDPGTKLPEWLNTIFICESLQKSTTPKEDVILFQKNGGKNGMNVAIIPSNPMHLDGVVNLRYESDIVNMNFGVKSSSKSVNGSVTRDNFYSTDLNNIYKENGIISETYKTERVAINKWYGDNTVHTIRICILYPNTTSSYPTTYNPESDTLFIEINDKNIHLLIQDKDTLTLLKQFIFPPSPEVITRKCTKCGLCGHNKSTCTSEERNYVKRKFDESTIPDVILYDVVDDEDFDEDIDDTGEDIVNEDFDEDIEDYIDEE